MEASLKRRLDEVHERIAAACERAGRRRGSVQLIAVTKGVALETVQEAVAAGVSDVGENRIQEARDKLPQLPDAVTRHLIGHLQTNKARFAVSLFDWVHSVDSLRVAEAIGRRALLEGKRVRCLVQVNASGESTKHGVEPATLLTFLEQVSQVQGIEVRGLMTMAPHTSDESVVRRVFAMTRQLLEQASAEGFPNVVMEHLSMGMSGDFHIAVEEGATMVRVGSALFGD